MPGRGRGTRGRGGGRGRGGFRGRGISRGRSRSAGRGGGRGRGRGYRAMGSSNKFGSANGAVIKHVKRWVRSLTKAELEFFALHFPKEPWKKLADICHFNPEKDFKNMTWFLPFCFGQSAPEDSMVHRFKDLTADNVNDLLMEYPVPYSHVKELKNKLTNESKARIACNEEQLDTLLWHYEDLKCDEVNLIINERIQNGDLVTLPNGKLLERLLLLKKLNDHIPSPIDPQIYHDWDWDNEPDGPWGANQQDSDDWGSPQNCSSGGEQQNVTTNGPNSDSQQAVANGTDDWGSPQDCLTGGEQQNVTTNRSNNESNADKEIKMEPKDPEIPFYSALVSQAENKLKNVKISLESPVVVVGDASGSMDIAIETSCIIAGILTAITSAKLVFFSDDTWDAPFLLKTVEDVIDLAIKTKTVGGTTPASSLYPFYKNKEIVKTFIIVTDEDENGEFEGYSFADLYKLYHDEVYPAKLVFVSFLHSHVEGFMVSQLRNLGFSPLQFKFSNHRPDLTKLDNLFGLLSTETSTFEEEVNKLEVQIKDKGLEDVFCENVAK
ncbi:hypothetical protein KUTeg_001421 [Tegillarca granosa]|uniref:Uncharacterized protein n=1 Tax=Tegillarca granosa TaxID=220873 RepID=A0ABQ9FRD3_TEGGR|nr:hypothetical protein KUTeg_001421 [Tegillarca granosa]